MQKFPVGMTPHSAGNRQKFRPALAIRSIDLSTVLTTVLKVLCAVLIADLTVALISVLKILSAVLAIALPTVATVYVLERRTRANPERIATIRVPERGARANFEKIATIHTCPRPVGEILSICPDCCLDKCPEDLKILGIVVITVCLLPDYCPGDSEACRDPLSRSLPWRF